jgi:putative transposase
MSTEEIARDLKVSLRRVQQIIKEYKETGQEPVLGEKVGRPAKAFDENEADAVRKAHAYYRFGARMLEPIISKQYMIRISYLISSSVSP